MAKAGLSETQLALSQNFPNPFNSSTTFQFHLLKPQPATVKIYDILGREVETLIDDEIRLGDN